MRQIISIVRTRRRRRKTKESGSVEKKSRVYGRTIGTPELSEKAKKYYEKLKAKYSNMDFILVSPDKKEEAERNKGMYASSKELLVLIDSDKIEKMAQDEAYRSKYEGILSMASAQVNQMKQELGSKGDSVRSVGMSFDDHGNASIFCGGRQVSGKAARAYRGEARRGERGQEGSREEGG